MCVCGAVCAGPSPSCPLRRGVVRMWDRLWRCDRRRVRVPGVVYSDEIAAEIVANADNFSGAGKRRAEWRGTLRNVRMETAPAWLVSTSGGGSDGNNNNDSNNMLAGPEEEPYTFWERVGIVPVHPSRVRPRQYYHPSTDFGLYDYDDVSPEERELTARWMAKVLEFNGAVPLGFLCAAGCIVLPLHTVYRMPLLVASGATGVMIEITRAYMSAARERQDLDDFILAKEIWYIKNVEAYQLGIPLIPKGRELEYQSYIDSTVSSTQELPDELINDLH